MKKGETLEMLRIQKCIGMLKVRCSSRGLQSSLHRDGCGRLFLPWKLHFQIWIFHNLGEFSIDGVRMEQGEASRGEPSRTDTIPIGTLSVDITDSQEEVEEEEEEEKKVLIFINYQY